MSKITQTLYLVRQIGYEDRYETGTTAVPKLYQKGPAKARVRHLNNQFGPERYEVVPVMLTIGEPMDW